MRACFASSSAVYNAAVQDLKSDTPSFFNFTFFDALNATATARAYLDDSSSFLLEEAAAVEAAGDATVAHLWKMAGGLIRLVVQVRGPVPSPHIPPASTFPLQSEPVLLFDVISPVFLAFPDLSNAPTLCSKALAVVNAYRGKTLLIPLPNPRYSPATASSQPRFKLSPLDLATDPIFNIIVSAVMSRCSNVNTSDLTGCEATMAMFDDLADNGPFWLRASLGKERILSIKRCVCCGLSA